MRGHFEAIAWDSLFDRSDIKAVKFGFKQKNLNPNETGVHPLRH